MYFCGQKNVSRVTIVFFIYIMKKVFMPFAVVALMVAASACGNNAKKAEAAEGEATEAAVEAATDTTTACCDSTAACCDSTATAE